MSEEQKVIKTAKCIRAGVPVQTCDDDYIVLLNIIEKQQKEIEENQVLIDDIKEHRIVYIDTPEFEEKFISKDKIREKIKAFQDVKKEIIKNENKLSRAYITYDIVRNDYCEKMLNQLLEEN